MSSRITKKDQREFLQYKLSIDSKWAKTALLRIYRDEKNMRSRGPHSPNGFGFSAYDRDILEPLARRLDNHSNLNISEMSTVKAKIKKYWKQILKVTDKEKLNSLIIQSRVAI